MSLDRVRTLLFTPGNRPDRFGGARDVGADGIVLDLEDAIPLADKDTARKIALTHFQTTKPDKDFLQCLRINSIKTPAGLKDVLALLDMNAHPDFLVIPKGEYAGEMIILDALLATLKLPYIILIETATGLTNAASIASSSPNVKAFIFGGADFAADIGADMSWESMLVARSTIVRVAKSAGIVAMDVPYFNLKDKDDSEILTETKRIKTLGFTAKCAIHPKHIKPILDTFSPTKKEVDNARHIVDVYEQAKGKVCEINGKMIDIPIYRSAKRILDVSTR